MERNETIERTVSSHQRKTSVDYNQVVDLLPLPSRAGVRVVATTAERLTGLQGWHDMRGRPAMDRFLSKCALVAYIRTYSVNKGEQTLSTRVNRH